MESYVDTWKQKICGLRSICGLRGYTGLRQKNQSVVCGVFAAESGNVMEKPIHQDPRSQFCRIPSLGVPETCGIVHLNKDDIRRCQRKGWAELN